MADPEKETEPSKSQENKPQTPPKEAPKQQDFKHGKKDFKLGQLLGGGSFAKVVEGTVINEDSPQYKRSYAIKVMDKRHIMKNDKIKYVTIEKNVFLATKPHPFICHLHFTFQDSYSLFMVLDLCKDEELGYQIWKYCGLNQELTVFYLSEIISCLEFMHSKGIFHRDIKPENILLHNDGHIRLTDFGTAKIVKQNKDEENEAKNEDIDANENNKNLYEKHRDRKESFVGTAQYVPPELLSKDSEISYAGMDFWALGILIYQCLLDETPFNAANEYLTFKRIEEHDLHLDNDKLSKTAVDIINAFLEANLEKRLGMHGFKDIKNHEFFENVKSWDYKEMYETQQCPKYPEVPKDSPIYNEKEKKKKELRGSVYAGDEALGDGDDEKVESVSVENVSISRQDSTKKMNAALYEKWHQFLEDEEQIVFGSQVEQSKMFGISSTKSVMIMTSNDRFLLIDNDKMQIRKNGVLNKKDFKECNVIDNYQFALVKIVKNKNIKFKCTAQVAKKWKNAFDN